MNSSLNLRPLTEADLPFADSLRALAGWNQTINDWRRLLALQADGCFLAGWDGAPAGTATTICYGTELAWIGMLLVHPEYRGRGIGTALLQQCIDFLQGRGMRCIKLDATPQGKPLYKSLGFREEWSLSRWKSMGPMVSGPDELSGQVRRLTGSDRPMVAKLDAQGFGVARGRLLDEMADASHLALVHVSPSDAVTGFAMLRPGSCALYLGPMAAASASVATKLIGALTSERVGQTYFWDIPDDHVEAKGLATRMGFRIQRPLMRMYLGENNRSDNLRLQFAIADPSVG